MANKRKIQEVNAGSMADISFLLLIFFLVATTMDNNQGLNRLLPPWVEDQEQMTEVLQRNILKVFVRADNVIMVNEEVMEIDRIKDKAKEFILNRKGDQGLPEIAMTEIEGLGEYPVSKGIISLRNDRGTTYGRYIAVQNELTKAFNELRDDVAIREFSKKYDDLDKDQQKAIQEAVPLKISEAEPHTMGGN